MSKEKSSRGKAIAELTFTRDAPGSNMWTCRCGTKRKQKGTGYSNLVSHVSTQHSELLQSLENAAAQDDTIENLFWPKKARDVMAWLELIILGLFPFSFCENKVVRKHAKPESISLNTFKKYMLSLTEVVEKKISEALPEQFAIVFDGWTVNSTHYVAVYATYSSSNDCGYERVLLSFAPMGEEETLTASEHVEYLEFVLSVFDKDMGNVSALVGDNCSTNKLLATLADCKFVGCASHRFNLVVDLD